MPDGGKTNIPENGKRLAKRSLPPVALAACAAGLFVLSIFPALLKRGALTCLRSPKLPAVMPS